MKKPFAITLDVGTSLENRTGSWRTLRPTYVHKLPPCNHQCPAGEDIQGWLFYAESGNYEKAWRHLTRRNPLPSCMGRVCYHTCEGACNRVKLELNTTVKDIEEEKNTNGYDAVFLAVGAGMAKNAYIPGGDAKHMLDAVSVLRSMEGEEEPLLGRKVVVYGGGNTAIDVARSAKRMGAEPLIIYRRTREKMPAHDFEVEEALQEGVSVKWLSTITEAENPKEIRIEKMKLDENGNPQPTGEFETVEADTVVLALGQNVDQSLIDKIPGLDIEKGVVKVDRFMRTGVPGIYAGGDMVPGDRNVTVAIGHGYKAAYGIDCYLKGQEPVDHPKKEIATFESLNTWYYSDAPKTVRPMLDLVRRTFDEVQHGLTEENALFEARRCMSCGNCLQCDNCYGVCPDNAVIKTGDDKVPYIFNYDYCKGCGVCSSECPCGAIKMEAESI